MGKRICVSSCHSYSMRDPCLEQAGTGLACTQLLCVREGRGSIDDASERARVPCLFGLTPEVNRLTTQLQRAADDGLAHSSLKGTASEGFNHVMHSVCSMNLFVCMRGAAGNDCGRNPGTASNYGKCVHLWAPGSHIESADNESDTATQYRSGTSQAVPFVAGAIALYLQNTSGALAFIEHC